jgi:hypothetical protein
MIRPGLLTASTNKADHLGTSGAGLVAYRCMVGAPFAACGFGLLNAGFPLRSDVRTRVGAQPTQGLPERSGGLGGFAESWRLGSRGRMRAKKGGTNSKLLGCDGAKRNEGEALLTSGARGRAQGN